MGRLAIIAGSGALPVGLAEAHPEAVLVSLAGMAHDLPQTREHQFEKLGGLFADLKAQGVQEVAFAGGMSRPDLDPANFDPFMVETAPRLMEAFQQGDDRLLRLIMTLFEEQEFTIRGAHELLPEAKAAEGLITGPTPNDQNLSDAARGGEILATLAPLDLGQGCVVASGLCLGIETLQGTDALLDFVARTPAHLHRTAGVFVKAPKAGQDLRVDMPAIGPETVRHVAEAGLAGIALAAGRVLILDRVRTLGLAASLGVFIYGQEEI